MTALVFFLAVVPGCIAITALLWWLTRNGLDDGEYNGWGDYDAI